MAIKVLLKITFVIMLVAVLNTTTNSFGKGVDIGFEEFPPGQGEPVDELEIFDQYKESHFVTFIIDQDGDPNTLDVRTKPLIEDRGGTVYPDDPWHPDNENGVQKVQLRGVKSTTGSNAALIVVNGFLRDDISYIIPSDIVSIKQLPPSAAAVYGTGSGNGVIAIKTK